MTKTKDELQAYIQGEKLKGRSNSGIARELADRYPADRTFNGWRCYINRLQEQSLSPDVDETLLKNINGDTSYMYDTTTTDTNQYIDEKPMSARLPDGRIMTPQAYCLHYGLPESFARTAKLVTHTGTPYYNIASNLLNGEDDLMPLEELKSIIKEGLDAYRYVPPVNIENNGGIIVVKISDLHFGAYIDGLIKTKKFSIGILADLLNEAAGIINAQNAKEVHVHIHGDLIESFTGLNHKNSWKGLQKSMVGAEVIKLCTQVLHTQFLGKIYNLFTVKVIAGNHDRVTSAKDEDVDGDAANLIAWGLDLLGYDIEFNALVITHVVDNIAYINLHGDKLLSKRPTKAVIWDYGVKGIYNVVAEGHLHALIEKQAVKKTDKAEELVITKDESVDCVRMKLRSFFTGNTFSEHGGWTSNSGFSIMKNNGKGVPHIFHFAL